MAKILISLIGKETIPNYQAYKEFSPDILIHIYSNVTKRASEIIESMIDKRFTDVVSIECDGWNFIDLLEKLNKNIKLIPSDILFVNVTGGTKMMALPVYEFAKEAEKENEVYYFYLNTESKINWFLEKGKSTFFTKQLTINEIISLQDQKLNSSLRYEEVVSDSKIQLKVIENDLDKNSSPWNKFLKYIKKYIRQNDELNHPSFEKISQLFNSKQELFRLKKYDDAIFLTYNGETYLKLSVGEQEAVWFLVNGGWFEVLTAKKLVKKYPNYEILLNVVFNFKSDEKIAKNEVDIFMCDGNKLIFVECKSGNISSKDIDTVKIRKDVYGGLVGQSILVGRYPLNLSSKHLNEKVKEYGVQYKIYNYL